MAASKSPSARLLHIRDEIEGVALIVHGLSFAQYQGSYLHRRAVERAVQIVSEAAKALPADYVARYPNAPWTSIVGIGNILRHEYQRLDDNQPALGNRDGSPAKLAANRGADADRTRRIARVKTVAALVGSLSFIRHAIAWSAATKQSTLSFLPPYGLLRFARNDGWGALRHEIANVYLVSEACFAPSS